MYDDRKIYNRLIAETDEMTMTKKLHHIYAQSASDISAFRRVLESDGRFARDQELRPRIFENMRLRGLELNEWRRVTIELPAGPGIRKRFLAAMAQHNLDPQDVEMPITGMGQAVLVRAGSNADWICRLSGYSVEVLPTK